MGHEDGDPEPNQFACQVREPIVLALGPAVVNDNILAFQVTQVTQARSKRFYLLRKTRRRRQTKESNPRDLRRLLRFDPERCR